MTKIQKLSYYESEGGQLGQLSDYADQPDNVRETLLMLSGLLRLLVIDLEGEGSNDTTITSDAARAVEEANRRCRDVVDRLGVDNQADYDLLYEAVALGWNAGVATQRLFMDQRERVRKAIRREQQQSAGAEKSRRNVTKEQIELLAMEKKRANEHLSWTEARKKAAQELKISERTMFRRFKDE